MLGPRAHALRRQKRKLSANVADIDFSDHNMSIQTYYIQYCYKMIETVLVVLPGRLLSCTREGRILPVFG